VRIDGDLMEIWPNEVCDSYPTDIDRQPDREERSQEKESSSITWQLR